MSTGRLGPIRIVWAAMVGGVLLYTLVIYGLMASGTLDMAALDPGIMNLVGAVVMVYLAAIVMGRRAVVAKIVAEADEAVRIERYRAMTIVTLALMEGGGLIVITLALVSGAPTWVLAGGGAAAGLMLLARPSEDELGS